MNRDVQYVQWFVNITVKKIHLFKLSVNRFKTLGYIATYTDILFTVGLMLRVQDSKLSFLYLMAFYTYHQKCQCTGFWMKRNQSVLLIGRKAAEEEAKRINFRSQLRFFRAVGRLWSLAELLRHWACMCEIRNLNLPTIKPMFSLRFVPRLDKRT